jgi:hypothetical protein
MKVFVNKSGQIGQQTYVLDKDAAKLFTKHRAKEYNNWKIESLFLEFLGHT